MSSEESDWTPKDTKKANRITLFSILFSTSWLAFLLIVIAPSCPNDKSPEYYFQYGEYFMANGNYTNAQIYYTKAIKIKPDYFEAYMQRAKSYEKSDSLSKAIGDYSILLSFPDMTVQRKGELLFMRATDYYKSLNDSLACKDWNNACELNISKACTSFRNNCKKK